MNWLMILAQADTTAEPSSSLSIPVDAIWEQVTSLGLVEALTFISFGVVCMFYGWRVFKILVTICFGLIGLIVGVQANKYLVEGNVVWLSLLCVILFAALSIPLMKYGVSLLGAVAGAIITSGLWLGLGLPQNYIWAGGLVGLVAGFLVSFVIFKVAVILFTSLGGSGLTVVGTLAILYKYMNSPDRLEAAVFEYKWLMPTMFVVPMVIGMALQYKFIKGEKDWAALG